jgi:hypothetical protein
LTLHALAGLVRLGFVSVTAEQADALTIMRARLTDVGQRALIS